MAVLGGVYYFVLRWIGTVLAGFGHGTNAFLYATCSPFSLLELRDNPALGLVVAALVFLFWPVVAALSVFPRCFAVFATCLSLHYAGVCWYIHWCIFGEERSYFDRVMEMLPGWLNCWGVIYAAGQVGLWVVAIKALRRHVGAKKMLPT
jgi:hypothetical protein